MNANELNRWIENSPYTEQEKVIVLLRQQQAEIEALKQQLVATSSEAKLNYSKGHEDGRQLGMKQERAMWELAASTQEIMDTHPVKELTDEEIDECSCFVGVELSQRYGSIESIDDIDWTITGLRAFARTVLRKAQEK